ncbi:MAG: peroxiredoxin [Vicinamibacterales bacterium]
MALKTGDEAPDFELRSHRGGSVRLSDFRGKENVVLAFHPLAFTPVCATQMSGYESDKAQLERHDAVVLGVSIDPQPAKTAWAKTLGGISFDLLSDFHPHGEVAQRYGVFRAQDGFSERAVFVVNKQGTIVWARVYDIPEQPNNEDVLGALRGLDDTSKA